MFLFPFSLNTFFFRFLPHLLQFIFNYKCFYFLWFVCVSVAWIGVAVVWFWCVSCYFIMCGLLAFVPFSIFYCIFYLDTEFKFSDSCILTYRLCCTIIWVRIYLKHMYLCFYVKLSVNWKSIKMRLDGGVILVASWQCWCVCDCYGVCVYICSSALDAQ